MSKISVEDKVYELMCEGCEHAHYCHNACENCDEYEDEVQRLYIEEELAKAEDELSIKNDTGEF